MKKNRLSDAMIEKIVLVANLYYKNKLSQQDIAKRLGVSRPWVSKLLSKADNLGIVKIEISSPLSGNSILEDRLMEKYGLSHAGVIDNTGDINDYVAMSAVNYFCAQVLPKDVVAVGWGNSVSRFVTKLLPLRLPKTQTVPLAGSFGTTFDTLPNYNVIELANRLGGTANVLHVPAFCSTREEYDALISNTHTQKILSMAETADIVIVGIGSFASSLLTRYDLLSPKDIKALEDNGAIGDIGLQFLDKNGQPVETDTTRRLVKADILKAAKNARCSIAFAEGEEKLSSIDAVLSNGLVNAFFTDQGTALALLSKDKTDK